MSEATREHVIEKSRQIIQSYVNRVKSFETQNDYLSIEGQSLINNYSKNIDNQKELLEDFLINDEFFENISDDQLILLMNKCVELNRLYELDIKDMYKIDFPFSSNLYKCEHNNDGAIDVAKYVVQEIKKNIKSEPANQIYNLLHYDYESVAKKRGLIISIFNPPYFLQTSEGGAAVKWIEMVN